MLKEEFIIFDFAGTLVRMRPASLLVKIELLEELSQKYSLGIITGARRPETVNILKKLGVYKMFKIIITADDSNIRKPNPKLFPKVNIISYIGDTKIDEVFSKKAKLPFYKISEKCNINRVVKKFKYHGQAKFTNTKGFS